MHEIGFRFRELSPPTTAVTSAARNRHLYPPEAVLSGPELITAESFEPGVRSRVASVLDVLLR